MPKHILAPLWDNLFRPRDSREARIAELWQATPLFRGIPTAEIRRLAATMHPRQYAPQERVFQEGDLGVGVALILEGSVEIQVQETSLTVLQPGDFFGEAALVSDERRTADALAAEPTEIVFFLRQDLEEWLDHNPRLGARMVQNLASVLTTRLRLANQQLSGQNPEP